MQAVNRLRELDFLRGIAILLVIFRHSVLFDFLLEIGWIGVDLFFVLSGFLVSGLLFKEYQKFGSVNPKLFLIRRGFKIYPIYYLTYLIYMAPRIMLHKKDLSNAVYDLTFTQNYVLGWGYAYMPSWSLAVEEHFYFGLVFLLWLIFNKQIMRFDSENKGFSNFEKLMVAALVLVLIMRFVSNTIFTDGRPQLITMSHLRIDSLLFGVLISYWYYFKREQLDCFYQKHQSKLLILAFGLLSAALCIQPLESFFVKTIGFTMLYLGFGIILLQFLLDNNINNQLNRLFSARGVNFISKIGYCSYSIYVIHSFVNYCYTFVPITNTYLSFFITFSISIGLGFIMTYKIEKFFLNFRDKYYPSRTI